METYQDLEKRHMREKKMADVKLQIPGGTNGAHIIDEKEVLNTAMHDALRIIESRIYNPDATQIQTFSKETIDLATEVVTSCLQRYQQLVQKLSSED